MQTTYIRDGLDRLNRPKSQNHDFESIVTNFRTCTTWCCWFAFQIAYSDHVAHEPVSLEEARAHVKRNENANHKCKKAIEVRNEQMYNYILSKRDAYDFVSNNETTYNPQGFNTSLCSLSEETVVGPYVWHSVKES